VRRVLGVLLVAAVVRLALAASGGFMFWGDEWHRWISTGEITDAIGDHHDPAEVARALARQIHFGLGFYGPGLLARMAHWRVLHWGGSPAAAELVAVGIVGVGGACALLLAVWWLARRLGASEEAALLALVCAACSTSLALWARHVTPYDWGLALALVAVGLAWTPSGFRGGLLTGAVVLAALFTHYGTTLVLATAGVAFAWRQRTGGAWVGAALGGLLVYLPIHVLEVTHGYRHLWLWDHLQRHPQGDVAAGWWTPLGYGWATEHGLLLAFGAACCALPWTLRAQPWLRPVAIGTACLYGGIVLASTGLGHLAVTGRYARVLVPGCCLLLAGALATLPVRWRRVALAALVVQAAVNLWAPLTLVFPRDVLPQIQARAEEPPDCQFTVTGPVFRADQPPARWHAVNACVWLYPVTGVQPVAGRIVASWPHPLQYLPLQYEVFTPAERALLATADLTMQLRVELPPE
jgi:hypothetical protein